MPSENAVVTFNISHKNYTNLSSPVEQRGRTMKPTTHRARFLSPIAFRYSSIKIGSISPNK